jgi:uncharacterized protein (DUF2141 family)
MRFNSRTLKVAASLLLSLFSLQRVYAFGKIGIHITNIKNKGTLIIGLYNKAESFRKPDGAYKTISIDPKGADQVTINFDNLPDGEYAIALFQDNNENKKMDTGAFGNPKEPYAFSNNVKPRFSAPGFADCKFIVQQANIQEIILINP